MIETTLASSVGGLGTLLWFPCKFLLNWHRSSNKAVMLVTYSLASLWSLSVWIISSIRPTP